MCNRPVYFAHGTLSVDGNIAKQMTMKSASNIEAGILSFVRSFVHFIIQRRNENEIVLNGKYMLNNNSFQLYLICVKVDRIEVNSALTQSTQPEFDSIQISSRKLWPQNWFNQHCKMSDSISNGIEVQVLFLMHAQDMHDRDIHSKYPVHFNFKWKHRNTFNLQIEMPFEYISPSFKFNSNNIC